MVHRSHISSKEAKARGWGRIPSAEIRAETYNLGKEVGTEFMGGTYLTLTASDNAAGLTTTGVSYADGSTTIYQPFQTWGEQWVNDSSYPNAITITQIIKEKEVTKEVEKRTLYKVYVVDPRKGGQILMDGKPVIALNENQAMLKAGVADVAEKASLEIEQCDVYVQCIGTFIRPRKDTQRVKVVKTDEEE